MLQYFLKMFKSTGMFILFRRTSMFSLQIRSCQNSPHFNKISQEKELFLSKRYEYYINNELSKRLSSIPYLTLMEHGAETVSKDLTSDFNNAMADVKERIQKVFDYNLKNDHVLLPSIYMLQVYCTYRFDNRDKNWNAWDSDDWKKAVILAWCYQLYFAFMLMHDDILDQSDLRKGQQCWYKMPGVGLNAIYDGLLLQCGIYKLLKKHFGSSKCYNSLVHEFIKATEQGVYGQCLDTSYNPQFQRPELFSFERYNTLIELKASRCFVCLPFNLVLHLIGGYSENEFDIAAQLGMKFGMCLQMRDDYLDWCEDSKVTGDDTNDIQNGRCTWLAVKFLEQASESEKTEFMENYGRNDEVSISKVLDLYNRSSLKNKYESDLDQLESEILAIIEPKRSWLGGVYALLISHIRSSRKF